MFLRSQKHVCLCKRKYRSVRGVTLIELLVVISIMMTMMSIVAPLAINTVDKASAQSEYLSFCNLLRKASIKAFSNGATIKVELNKHQVIISKVATNDIFNEQNQATSFQLLEQHFEFLSFDDSVLFFNKNGMVDITVLQFRQGNKTRQLDLIALLEQ
ncbi:Tfp pilus assembly protein FimT/FimU [Thalassotalea sp. PP2-459]|uniref:pilus assembly FimT family protein n=1 Tax=Thalassotalea sp. PP2-459 TaxID=1742724 RepID=UPI000945C8DB|nr:prepilin-type N-terminal cleavage/methylation domain-containing protein [Thalassotalea sp. PP2-459]OKY24660.1 hypothetical protein BI291_05555 [Thalassotalea sp. PP2-459]